jgi:probable HAF family extracellular repeat protein
MTDLGTLPGTYSSQGLAINDAGQVVGSYLLRGGNFGNRAFLYSNGHTVDLNNLIDPTLGITLSEANAINNNGQIVARSSSRAYLLTPTSAVPEPSTWALFGVALLGLGAWVRRHPSVFR